MQTVGSISKLLTLRRVDSSLCQRAELLGRALSPLSIPSVTVLGLFLCTWGKQKPLLSTRRRLTAGSGGPLSLVAGPLVRLL